MTSFHGNQGPLLALSFCLFPSSVYTLDLKFYTSNNNRPWCCPLSRIAIAQHSSVLHSATTKKSKFEQSIQEKPIFTQLMGHRELAGFMAFI